MRYLRTDSFKSDYRRLPANEQQLFRLAAIAFNEACDRFAADGTPFPGSLRVKPVAGAPGVFEMTWSFSGPDGRATFEWVEVDVRHDDGTTTKERAVCWRRVGTHRIVGRP